MACDFDAFVQQRSHPSPEWEQAASDYVLDVLCWLESSDQGNTVTHDLAVPVGGRTVLG